MATPLVLRAFQAAALCCLLVWLAACAPPRLPAGATIIPQTPATVDGSPDATSAMATIQAALNAPASPTMLPTDTPALVVAATFTPQPTITVDAALSATALANDLATKVAATLTAQPSATPDLAATATAQAQQIASAIAATLTAQPTPTAPGTATPTPTATPDLAAGATAQAQQIASAIAATLTAQPPAAPTDTPMPPPTAVACAIPPAAELAGYWSQGELGCAVENAHLVWSSWTPYERGHSIWRRDDNTLYVLYNSGGWQSFRDEWDGVSEPPSRGAPPPGLQAPIRGSGWIWGTNETVFQGLGWARDKQKGFCALVQGFEQGFILRSSTVEFCHEENLYNFAREPGFGLNSVMVHRSGYWRQ
jgi:hypothetical protein